MLEQPEAVHVHEGNWFFWDETGGNRCGPFPSRERADEGLRLYCANCLGIKPRPVLIGMNNPYGVDPKYALYPLPERATGHRIWEMLDEIVSCSKTEYRDRFARYNAMSGREWNLKEARLQTPRLVDHWLGSTVLVFGTQTRDALWLPAVEPLTWHVKQWGQGRTTWAWAPHPSGRNQWYNNVDNRARVAGQLARMYLGLDA